MQDKQVTHSSTIQGVTGLLVLVLTLLGVEVTQTEQMDVTKLIGAAVVTVLGLVAYGRAFYGRLRANRNLRFGKRKL